MTAQEKNDQVQGFLKTADLLQGIPELPPEVLDRRDEPDWWTVREHLIHIMDVEVLNFGRYRLGFVRPGDEAFPMGPGWTEALSYSSMDAALALSIIRSIRQFMAAHLLTVLDKDWKVLGYKHPVYGFMPMETFLETCNKHLINHKDFIDRNLKAAGIG